MKAVIYAAKSTIDVHDSLSRQVADCEALASREELEVAERQTDEAESAYHGDRGPGLRAAMDACERLAPCALVVQHTSRLARGDGVGEDGARSLNELVAWARRKHVVIKSVENPIPEDPSIGDVIAAVYSAQDHAYSKRLATSVRGGLRGSFQRGNWPGKASDGYVVRIERGPSGKTARRWLEVDEAMRPTISRLFDLAIGQMLSTAEIARVLNEDGLRNGRGQPWRSRDVKRVLTNPMYAGTLRWMGEERRDACPTYVHAKQHEALVERYGETTSRRGRQPAEEGYVLRGLAECSCGARMYCHTRRDMGDEPVLFYRCGGYHHPGTGACGRRARADEVDAEVLRWLPQLISDFDDWREEVVQTASAERDQAQRELDQALAEIDRADARASKIESDYLAAIDRGDDAAGDLFARLIARTRAERATAEETAGERRRTVEALSADVVGDRLSKTVERLSSQDVRAVNEALRVEFVKFVIDPGTGEMTPEWKPADAGFSLGKLLQTYHEDTPSC